MTNYLILIGLSMIPAMAGILITRPTWKLKYLRNDDISFFGATIMVVFIITFLILTIVQTSSSSNWTIGLLCAPASILNLYIYSKYTSYINRKRCPYCHQNTLHLRLHNHGRYRLHCNNCGSHSEWKR